MAVNAGLHTLYAADWANRRVVAIVLTSTSTVTEVPIYPALRPGGRPWGLGLSADGNTLWVTEDTSTP